MHRFQNFRQELALDGCISSHSSLSKRGLLDSTKILVGIHIEQAREALDKRCFVCCDKCLLYQNNFHTSPWPKQFKGSLVLHHNLLESYQLSFTVIQGINVKMAIEK
ncbi:hypothetical protein ACP275_11G087300 [Erythranthe tilingii]